MLLAAMLHTVLVKYTAQCLSFHLLLHSVLRMSLATPLTFCLPYPLALHILSFSSILQLLLSFSFLHPINLISFHPLLLSLCPCLSFSLPSAVPGCGECLAFEGICISLRVRNLTAQITDMADHCYQRVMRSSRERMLFEQCMFWDTSICICTTSCMQCRYALMH